MSRSREQLRKAQLLRRCLSALLLRARLSAALFVSVVVAGSVVDSKNISAQEMSHD